MAKKFTLADVDFSRYGETGEDPAVTRRRDAVSEIDAVIKQIEADSGIKVTPEQRAQAILDAEAGREYSFQFQPEQPVVKPAQAVPSVRRGSLDERLNLGISSGLSDIAADIQFRDIRAADVEAARKAKEEQRIAESDLPEPLARVLYTDVVSPLVAKAGEAIGGNETYRNVFGTLSKYTNQARQDLAAQTEARVKEAPILGRIERAITDAAASGPQSLASIPGGPFAAIPALTTYNDALRSAIEAGASPEAAANYAEQQAAVEGGISAIPTGKLFRALTRTPAKGLAGKIAGVPTRIAATGIGEAAEEVTQTVGADLVNRLTSIFTEDEALEKFAQENISKDLTGDAARAAAAAFAGGTAVSSISAPIEKAHEAGRQAAETEQKARETSLRRIREERLRKEREDQEVTDQIRDIQEEMRKQAEIDTAFAEREQEDARRRADEEEAGFRTMENLREFGTPERLEEYAGVKERTPIQPPASVEVRPEQVAEERVAAEEAEAERVDRAELGQITEQVRKQREKEEKAAEKKTKAEEKKAKAAEAKRVQEVIANVRAANPGVVDNELAPLVREALKAPVETAAKPEATPVASTPVKTDKQLVGQDKEIAELASTLNLGHKAVNPESKEYDEADFVKKSSALIKGLVKANRQDTADVQNLLRQGKLILAPNPESIGRKDDGNEAEYDTEEGQMYLYTDRVNPKNTVAVMQAALHEPLHAGQFNERQGRGKVLQEMMGQGEFNRASQAIRKAATAGNKQAKAALAKSEAASDDKAIQDLELVPYFVSEAVKARGGTLGQLRGVANDIRAGANNFLREKLGVDLDVSLADVESAAHKVAGEIVKTDVKGKKGGPKTLAMVMGPTATGFQKAKAEGKTYIEAADQGERFEISDAEAEIPSDRQLENLIPFGPDETTDLRLDDFLDHDKLYNQYEWLAPYNLQIKDLGLGVYGSHDPDTKTISLNSNDVRAAVHGRIPEARQQAKDKLRETVLHETQHAIQSKEGFVAGANSLEFMPQSVINDQARAEEKVRDVVKRFDLGRAVQTLSPEAKRTWDNEVKASGTVSRDAQAALFLDEGYYADVNDRFLKRYGETTYQNAVRELTAANRAVREAENKAYLTYLKDQGEMEARATERRSRMTQAELEAAPRTEMGPEEIEIRGRKELISREQAIDTRPLARVRKPAESKQQPATLGKKAEPKEEKQRYFPVAITSLFRNDKGLGRKVLESVEHSLSAPSEAKAKAEAAVVTYDAAIREQAADMGISPEQLNAQIQKDMEAIPTDIEGYEANRKAFDAVADKYGDAGKQLKKLRQAVDDMTLEMLRQRAASGTPLTPEEKLRYKAAVANLGRYVNRSYAVNAGKIGKRYANTVWNAYEKYKKKDGNVKPEVEENYKLVANAVSYIVDNQLMIPEDKVLAEMDAETTRSLYKTWGTVGNPDALTVEQMKEELAANRDAINGDRDSLTKEAERITQDLLQLTDPTSVRPMSVFLRGGSLDRGILQERKRVPKELRDLMGEIKDPAMRMLITAGKQAEFIARNKMLLEMRDLLGGDLKAPGKTAPAKWHKLEGETWGPLEGYSVSPNARALLGNYVEQLATFEQAIAMVAKNPKLINNKVLNKSVDLWSRAAKASKIANIMMNPLNFLYNLAGSPLMLLNNGNVNPKSWIKGGKAAAQLAGYAVNPQTAGPEALKAIKYGITDSATVGEITQEQWKQLSTLVKRMEGKDPSKAMEVFKDFISVGKETYAMMDVWAKMSNFFNEVDVLTSFYEKNGDVKTEDEIAREAADIVNHTNITHKRAAPLVKAMEGGALTQYAPYLYEVFRHQVANMAQGLSELKRAGQAKTPEAKLLMSLRGGGRLVSQAAMWTIIGATTKALAGAFGDDDEERKAKRALLPEYLRDQDFLKIGTTAEGKDALFNVSRLDPIGPMTDIMRGIQQGGMDVDTIRDKLYNLYIAPRLASRLYDVGKSFTPGGVPSREPTVQQAFPAAYTRALQLADMIPGVEDKNTLAATNLIESWFPGFTNSWRDTNARPANDPALLAATYGGLQLAQLDADKAVVGAAIEYSDTLSGGRKELANLFSDRTEVSENDVIEKIIDFRQSEKEAFNRLSDIYDGMLADGKTPRQAAATLKESKVPQEVITDIRKGTFTSRMISKASLDQFAAKEMKGKTLAEKREIKQKWKDAYELLHEAGSGVGGE